MWACFRASVVDATLRNRPYICGAAFSAADIMVGYGLAMSRIIPELPAELTHVAGYIKRAHAVAWA